MSPTSGGRLLHWWNAPAFRITGERKRLLVSFLAVFLFGLLAHGYAFANLTLSHDSLNELYLWGDVHTVPGSVAAWKISLGRFLYPAYHAVFSASVSTPWLSGMLALVWVSLAVYLIGRMFAVDHALVLTMIGGICVSNMTVSALAATYINDLDSNMLAVFFAVYAAYLWQRRTGWRRVLAAAPLVLSLALYQAMLSVTVTLMMFVCILRLLDGERVKPVLLDGVKAIGILALGGAVYYVLARVVSAVAGAPMGEGYNSLHNIGDLTLRRLPAALVSTYKTWGLITATQPLGWSAVSAGTLHALLGVLFLAAVPGMALRRELPAGSRLLALGLLALLPLAMNLSHLLNYAHAGAHKLMMYAFCLVYLLDILLLGLSGKRRPESGRVRCCTAASFVLIAALLWGNVQTANTLYLKKDLERQATLSQMTDVRIRLEQTEGYVPGETPVAFVGFAGGEDVEAFDRVVRVTGANLKSMLGNEYYAAYFEYVLQTPVRIVENGALQGMPEVQEMPVFPAEGSIRRIGETIVVRMSE